MKKKNNIKKFVQESVKKNLSQNHSLKEKAAFEMLQQRKIRKFLDKDVR